jgi:nucleoside-triphosphatase THEP1
MSSPSTENSLPTQDFIKEKLANHVATKHEYTDQSKTFCAENTRVGIQAEILQWLSPQTSSSKHIFWITGFAGSGKSTLSATIVDTLGNKKTPVAAQFFISRNIPETINSKNLVPTIAKQLAEFSPAAARIIYDTLKNRFSSSLEDQVKELLLAPIKEISNSRDVVVIVIDALDELQNAAKSVMEILTPIAKAGCDVPDNVRFIITSRPEHWADISRSETLEHTVFKRHNLATESSREEVDNFIVARMKHITPRDWADWPTPGELARLSNKADGLFHYAATALQWIEGQIEKYKKTCQPWVFEQFTQAGIGQLEDLYRLILASFEDIAIPAQARDVGLREHRLRRFRHVIGTILVLDQPLTIRQVASLLADIPVAELDVEDFLQQFRSVLIPGTTASYEEATPQMHKSFRDYIMNAALAEFRICTCDAQFLTATSCMEVIVKAASQSTEVVGYCVEHWHEHLRKAVETGMTWEGERMWQLFGKMVEDAVVDVWKKHSWPVFIAVAAAGWKLLKVSTNYGRESQGNNDVPARY